MNEQHTKMPLIAKGDEIGFISKADDQTFGMFVPQAIWFGENSIDNASRIVACVNACEGIETKKLEGKTIAEYVSDEAYIGGMTVNKNEFGIELNGLACQLLANSFAGQFVGSGAVNFLQVNLNHKELGAFSVTVQREQGKSLGELKRQADQQRDELLAALKVAANFIPTTAIHEYQLNFDGEIQDHSVSVKKLIESAIAKAES